MSIARAFTTRRNKPVVEPSTPAYIGRAASQRAGKPVLRAQISSPVMLLSTSNVLLNNAQDIAGTAPVAMRNASSGSSTASSSGDDSDASAGSAGSTHSGDTVTDASSVDESPTRTEPEPNHLSCYFKPNVDTQSPSSTRSSHSSARPSLDTPRLPQRVPSHSKKAHESVARKRSVRRMMSPVATTRDAAPHPARSSSPALASPEPFSPVTPAAADAPPADWPFGRELAQLAEVAEEFGGVARDAEADADLAAIKAFGLAQLAASDYVCEIQSLIDVTFLDEPATPQDHGGWF